MGKSRNVWLSVFCAGMIVLLTLPVLFMFQYTGTASASDMSAADKAMCAAWEGIDYLIPDKGGRTWDAAHLKFTKRLEEAYNANPKHTGLAYSLGRCFEMLEEYQAAANMYTIVLMGDDQFAGAYAQRGMCYEVLKNYEAAAADYARASELLRKNGQNRTEQILSVYKLSNLTSQNADWSKLRAASAAMEEKLEAQKPDPNCTSCKGTGTCRYCNGSGMDGSLVLPCFTCKGTAQCKFCHVRPPAYGSGTTPKPTATAKPTATVKPTSAPTSVPAANRPASYLVAEVNGVETLFWCKEVVSYLPGETMLDFRSYDQYGRETGYLFIQIPDSTGTVVYDSKSIGSKNLYISYTNLQTYAEFTVQAMGSIVTNYIKPSGASFKLDFKKNGSVFTGTFSAVLVSERPTGLVRFKNGSFHFDGTHGKRPVPTLSLGAGATATPPPYDPRKPTTKPPTTPTPSPGRTRCMICSSLKPGYIKCTYYKCEDGYVWDKEQNIYTGEMRDVKKTCPYCSYGWKPCTSTGCENGYKRWP